LILLSGAPVRVVSISAPITLRSLIKKNVTDLDTTFVIAEAIGLQISTGAQLVQVNQDWIIKLQPKIKVNFQKYSELKVPELSGIVAVHVGRNLLEVSADLTTSDALNIKVEPAEVMAKKISLKGVFTLSHQTLIGDLTWSVDQIQMMYKSLFHELNKASGSAQYTYNFTKKVLSIESFDVAKPFNARGQFSIQNNDLSGDLKLEGQINDVMGDFVSSNFSHYILLKNAKIDGKYAVNFKIKNLNKVNATYRVDFSEVNLPGFGLISKGASVRGIFPGEFTLLAKNIKTNYFILDHIQSKGRILTDSVKSISSEPIQINLNTPFLGALSLTSIDYAIFLDGTYKFTAVVETNNIDLSSVQKGLCIFDRYPIPEKLKANYRITFLSSGELDAEGSSSTPLWGGELKTGNLKVDFNMPTQISAVASVKQVSLEKVSAWANFGRVVGLMDIVADPVVIQMRQEGPMPVDYDFLIRGYDTPERSLNFSSEALDNLLDMMGVKDSANNIAASFAFRLWRTFGKVLPFVNNMDYFGFRAVNRLGYTTLETFDPINSKNHYLIKGNSFKMPIKSIGIDEAIYPIVMKTNDFQSWLWARVRWFLNRNTGSQNEQKCSPIPLPF
jgi:hypothetical protein